jgi:hypothetical protein
MMGGSTEAVYNRKGGGRQIAKAKPEDFAPSSADSFVQQCRRTIAGYPEGHIERAKTEEMIEKYQKINHP